LVVVDVPDKPVESTHVAPVQYCSLYVLAPPVGAPQETPEEVAVTLDSDGVPGVSGSVSCVVEAEYAPSPVAFVPRTAKLYVVFPVSAYVVVETPEILEATVQEAPVQYWSLYVLAPPVGALQLRPTVVAATLVVDSDDGVSGIVSFVDVAENALLPTVFVPFTA
jgi:hypothetical protein